MVRSPYQRVGRIVVGVLIVAALLVTTVVVLIWYQWRQDEREVLDEQARQAEVVRGKLERLRERGPLVEADVVMIVRRAEYGTVFSMTERTGETYIVADVGALGGPALGVQSGPDYACFGFTVPDDATPVTVERLSPEEGRRPEECRGGGLVVD